MHCRLDLVVVDLVDVGNPRVDQVRIAVQRRVLAQGISARVDTRQLVQPMALELGFGAPQFVFSRPVGDQLVDQLYGFLLELFGADAVSSAGKLKPNELPPIRPIVDAAALSACSVRRISCLCSREV